MLLHSSSMKAVRAPCIVVFGGGDVGEVSVRHLLRAVSAGRLETDEIVVVDRNPGCAAAFRRQERDGRAPAVRVAVADWADWLDEGVDGLGPEDQLVPYHWAPHLFLGWLERQVARASGRLRRIGPAPARGWPFEHVTSQGDAALSYATWPCPPLCIEPALCPHTRGPRDWSLAGDLETPVAAEPIDGRIVFRCLHLVWGVGTVPARDLVEARDRVRAGLAGHAQTYLVATSSHCHGLAALVRVQSGE
jgi:hypothetical protein